MLEVFLVDVISWCVWTISVDNADSSLSIITNYSECDVRYSFNARKLSLFFVYKLPFSGCDVVISVFFFLFPNSWLWLFAMSQQNLDFSIYYIFSVTLLSLQRSVLSLYLSYLWTSDCNIFLLPKLVKHTSTKVYTFRLVYDMLWVPFSLIVFFLMFLRVSSLLLSVAAVKVGTRFGLHME